MVAGSHPTPAAVGVLPLQAVGSQRCQVAGSRKHAGMATVRFTANLARHFAIDEVQAAGSTVADVLASVFAGRDRDRDYVLDDQGHLRKHMSVFVDGEQIRDRTTLSDAVGSGSVVDIIQALSGG